MHPSIVLTLAKERQRELRREAGRQARASRLGTGHRTSGWRRGAAHTLRRVADGLEPRAT
jgi:hypothetical protein